MDSAEARTGSSTSMNELPVSYSGAGTLRAVAFDLRRIEVLGTPVPVLEQVMPLGGPEQTAAPPSLIVVQHWFEERKRLVPANR